MSRLLRYILHACVALGATLQLAAPAAADAPAGFRPFAPDSIWNLRLRPDAPLSADSAAEVQWLSNRVNQAGAWVNVTKCGMPFYWADAGTPKVKVTLDHPSYMDPALIRAWSAVPIPPGAKPANCSDHNFAVLQTQPDGSVREWEFWAATQGPDGSWTAKWGGAISDIRRDRGFASKRAWTDPTAPTYLGRMSTPGWNVTASSASMLGGVVTLDELARGSIDHALAVAIPDAARGRWLWPAQRSDGGLTDPLALPEGAHLRIDPSVNLNTITMTPLVRMLATAAQDYGIVVRDRTFSSVAFYVQEPPAGVPNPVPTLLRNEWPNQALRAFPWSKLQLLDAPTCRSYSGCSVPDRAVIDVDDPAPTIGTPVRLDTTNSALDFPRSRVSWDLDGDGRFETDGGTAADIRFTPSTAGPLTVRVQIVTQDGSTVTAARVIDVRTPVPPAAPAASSAVPARQRTVSGRIVITGTLRRTVRAGTVVRLRAVLRDHATSALSRTLTMHVQRSGVGSHRWRNVGRASRRAEAFVWRGPVRARAGARLRYRLLLSAGNSVRAVSRQVEIRVRR